MAPSLRTPEEQRRRKALLGWIPALVIVVILVAGVWIALVVAGQGIGQPRTLPPAVGPNGYSTFDDAGQRYISDERTVWIDLRQSPIRASELSLPDAGTLVIGPRDGVSYYLGLYGNDTPVKLAVDSIDITTDAGILTTVTAHVVPSGGFADVEAALGQATAYGLADADVTAFTDDARVQNRAGKPYSRSITGTALGVPIDVKVQCASATECSVDYVARVGE